jgi:hypothetical protein
MMDDGRGTWRSAKALSTIVKTEESKNPKAAV